MNEPRENRRNLLIVDDEFGMRAALHANFRRESWGAETAANVADAMGRFKEKPVPLVITDMRMPDGTGLDLMRQLRMISPDVAIILLTAYGNVPEAVQAMKMGVCDYLVKPVSFTQLHSAALRITSQRPVHAESEIRIIGGSSALRVALDRARRAARSNADVLVQAESGTGKELLARLIHQASSRRGRAFVAVNCAAVPENLLESELFGHVRGAFTGAMSSRIGKFEQADGGTLLLDEVGEMPLPLQAKLLRVLQEREVDRLGDTRPVKVDVRVIATTNRSLRQLVEEHKFRSDLYYRINVIPLTLPPLRDRREDIPELALHFARLYTVPGCPTPILSQQFIDALKEYGWPGNVRELANFMRRVLALNSKQEIGIEYVDPAMTAEPCRSAGGLVLEPGVSLRDAERRLLEVTLQATEGNRTRTAELLGVSLRTVRNKIRDYGLPKRSYA